MNDLNTPTLDGSGKLRSAHELRPRLPDLPGYALLNELGRGSMGIVYLAHHHGLNRQVALKMILVGAHADPTLITRFYAETQTVAKLQHPNIVQVFDSGWCNGLPYCTLELLPGGNLADRLDGTPCDARKAAELVVTLARAIHAAHQAGVVHRDLKPANILFDGDGRPKITDFGVAKDLQNPEGGYTQSGDIIGTPSYMAPEQAGGASKTVGPAADIYALGVLLYELLTGDVPFVGQDPVDVMIQVRQLEPVPPRKRVHSVPVDLDVICMKCLEKDPRQRYASAAALADDLQAFLDDRPIQARPVSEWEKFRRWGRRNPVMASLITALVGVLLMAFILLSVNYWQAQAALQTEAGLRQESQQREKAERWARYRASISAAGSALQLYNLNLARQALENAPLEHHNWEWHHFARQLEGAEQVYRQPHGTRFLLHGEGDTAHLILGRESVLWDALRDRTLKRIQQDPDSRVVFAPDRRTYLVARPNRPLELHDLTTDELLYQGPVTSAGEFHFHYSPDSSRLLLLLPRGVQLLDARTGRMLYEYVNSNPNCFVQGFSQDSRRCSFCDRDRVNVLLDAQTGQVVRQWPLTGKNTSIGKLSPSGDRLLIAREFPATHLELWDPETATCLATLHGHENAVFQIAFSPDGRRLATGSMDQSVRLWDARTGAVRFVLQGHRGCLAALAFSPDSKRLVTGSQDHTLRWWDVERGRELSTLLGHTREVEHVHFTPDGTEIISWGADCVVRRWNVATIERQGALRGHDNFVYGVSVHPEGRLYASAAWDGTVRLWDGDRMTEVARFEHAPGSFVTTVAFSPRGTHLASAGRDGTVRVWNLAERREEHRWEFSPSNWRDCRLAFNPDGKLLAMGDHQGNIRLWDLESGKPAGALPSEKTFVADLAFSPDGCHLLAVGESGVPVLWDVATRQVERRLERSPTGFYGLTFSHSGRLVALAAIDGTISLVDAKTWDTFDRLEVGTRTYSVAFSPDETRLAIGCANTTIHLWDVQRRQEVAELNGHTRYVHQVAFTPDGKRLISASGDHTVRVWDTTPTSKR